MGSAPNSRESVELLMLSPCSQTCPRGTVFGKKTLTRIESPDRPTIRLHMNVFGCIGERTTTMSPLERLEGDETFWGTTTYPTTYR